MSVTSYLGRMHQTLNLTYERCTKHLTAQGSVTPQLDLELIPDDVKETAAALGINLETLNTPVTIEEVTT